LSALVFALLCVLIAGFSFVTSDPHCASIVVAVHSPQVNAQLHEALNAAEARATDAEARLAEERESNAVRCG
jgi:hypothetical protein